MCEIPTHSATWVTLFDCHFPHFLTCHICCFFYMVNNLLIEPIICIFCFLNLFFFIKELNLKLFFLIGAIWKLIYELIWSQSEVTFEQNLKPVFLSWILRWIQRLSMELILKLSMELYFKAAYGAEILKPSDANLWTDFKSNLKSFLEMNLNRILKPVYYVTVWS